ncbi:hypothetical protein SBOR_7274 [Sclerotinia borealis F-4128]|uniref:Uncharacterized protein n=1 Tax=Sclerotinia borealis (strain F-4128) TaxID=1432307 RepID=W9CCT0_SCLBF|nr:hypothetical protein SBOR_7274 [Sclerotinia borealis F-4128]
MPISMFSRSRLRLLITLGLSLCFADAVRGQYGAVGMENNANALSPRYYMGLEEGRLLGRGSGVCSNCDTPCSSDSYLCNKTLTISSTTTVTSTCCPRACPSVSLYKCATSLGGGCCNYNAQCISSDGSGACAVTISSSSTTALVSIIPSGCTTNQFACATFLGGGCCDVGFGCTVLSGTKYCAATTGSASAVRTGSNGIMATDTANSTSSNHSLSTGAKAGIGVGVSIFALASIGACIFFITIHRRRSLSSKTSSHPDADADADADQENLPAAAMSQVSGSKADSKSGKRPTGFQRQESDYFGATAARGPFTEELTSAVTSPGFDSNRGVPVTPQSPNDIAAPVEIGGGEREGWGYEKRGELE